MSLTVTIVRMNLIQGGYLVNDIKIPVPPGMIVKTSYKTRAEKAKLKEKVKAKKKAAAGRTARRKGHSFEREVAILFRQNGYPKAHRQLEYQEGLGVDITEVGIYDPQCKRTRKYTSLSAIKEVPRKEGRVPLLIAKEDFGEILVAMPISHFFELLNKQKQKELTNVDDTTITAD